MIEYNIVATTSNDLDELINIRIVAMKSSLEKIGRFDIERAKKRLVNSFDAKYTKKITVDNALIGFYALRPVDNYLKLDHLYIIPEYQEKGIGSKIIASIISEGAELNKNIKLCALIDSEANNFYVKHGFILTKKDEFDNYYEYIINSMSI
jgi:GNAT superfamily N-acetyltransferase